MASNPLLSKENQCLNFPDLPSLIGLVLRNDAKDKNNKVDNRPKGTKKKIFKISTVARCTKCQGYRHIAIDYTILVRIVNINRVLL